MAEETPTSDQNDPNELEALRAELDQYRARATSAESAAQQERQRRIQAERAHMTETERSIALQQDAVEGEIDGLSREADGIEERIAELADEPGHGAEIAKLNRRMSQIESSLSRAHDRNEYLAGMREQAKERSAADSQPTGKILANGARSDQFLPSIQKWFDDHPQVYTDAGYLNRVSAAAQAAEHLHGLTPDNPEYFAFVEREIGERRAAPAQRQDDGDDVATADSPYSRTAPAQVAGDGEEISYEPSRPQGRAAGPGSMAAVAPPSRSVAQGGNTRRPTRQPTLTRDEAEVALNLYPVGTMHQGKKIASAADAYATYAQAKEYMASRQSQHFAGNA